MDFAKLNENFLKLEKDIEKYNFQSEKILIELKRIDKKIHNLNKKCANEKCNIPDKRYYQLVISLYEEFYLTLKEIFNAKDKSGV